MLHMLKDLYKCKSWLGLYTTMLSNEQLIKWTEMKGTDHKEIANLQVQL